MGCHLAGACPYEYLDISPWAEAAFQHFLHHPLAQRLPRKFKINFSGCETDCGQAMFNDVGVIATTRTLEDGTARPASACSSPAASAPTRTLRWPSRSSRPRGPARHDRGDPPRVLQPRQPRQQAPRCMKWLVDTMGWDELQAHPQGASSCRQLHLAGRHPRDVQKHGDEPAGLGLGTPTPRAGHAGVDPPRRSVQGVGRRQRRARRRQGHRVGASPTPASATSPPRSSERWPRSSASSAPTSASPTARTSFSGLSRASCRCSTSACPPSAWPSRAPSWRDVACPGADTCNLAVTQSRGLADAIAPSTRPASDVGGIRTNISGCTNSCGQHHISDIGSSAPSAAPTASRPRLPAAARRLRGPGEGPLRREGAPAARQERPKRWSGWSAGSTTSGSPARSSAPWIDRSGGVKTIAEDLREPRRVPRPRTDPSTTSTTARRARTSPRPATRSAQRELVEVPDFTDEELAELNREFEHLPAIEDHPVGGRQLRATPQPQRR